MQYFIALCDFGPKGFWTFRSCQDVNLCFDSEFCFPTYFEDFHISAYLEQEAQMGPQNSIFENQVNSEIFSCPDSADSADFENQMELPKAAMIE